MRKKQAAGAVLLFEQRPISPKLSVQSAGSSNFPKSLTASEVRAGFRNQSETGPKGKAICIHRRESRVAPDIADRFDSAMGDACEATVSGQQVRDSTLNQIDCVGCASYSPFYTSDLSPGLTMQVASSDFSAKMEDLDVGHHPLGRAIHPFRLQPLRSLWRRVVGSTR